MRHPFGPAGWRKGTNPRLRDPSHRGKVSTRYQRFHIQGSRLCYLVLHLSPSGCARRYELETSVPPPGRNGTAQSPSKVARDTPAPSREPRFHVFPDPSQQNYTYPRLFVPHPQVEGNVWSTLRVSRKSGIDNEAKSMKALITGSGGLIGSACSRLLAGQGWEIVGVDNNMRQQFFGVAASTSSVVQDLQSQLSAYRHQSLDIRDRQGVRDLIRSERPDFIVHTAAQPSHDKAASIPYEDFDVNAVGTLNLLVAARDFCRESPICFTSTNKVYGDNPNQLRLIETQTRWDYADDRDGVDETMSIDNSLHSLFGASKVAADVLCQEFGRYFGMPVGIFRCGCLTGPSHAAVELHGYLAHIVKCAVNRRKYTIFGYKGKQVRDQLHSSDVASLFLAFFNAPRCGEVYNLGGGRSNSLSILETIDALALLGFPLRCTVSEQPRIGDHICYISALDKVRSHFPSWSIQYSVSRIVEELVAEHAGVFNAVETR